MLLKFRRDCRKISTLACQVDFGFYFVVASQYVSDSYCKALLRDVFKKEVFLI